MGNCRKSLVLLLVVSCMGITMAHATPRRHQSTAASSQKGSTESPSAAAENNPGYRIGPLDVLNIDVWKEPNISHIVPVRADGKISLPLLNDVQAGGLTPMELAAAIREQLGKFISDPQVTVIVTEMNSQRVYIMGEVTRAGAYPLLPNMTVLQALSSAGGFTQFASVKKIYVLRRVDGQDKKIHFNYKDVVGGNHPEQNVVLQAGDTIVVP
jgi:polysaccharide biosynthesis/export protein